MQTLITALDLGINHSSPMFLFVRTNDKLFKYLFPGALIYVPFQKASYETFFFFAFTPKIYISHQLVGFEGKTYYSIN